MRQINREEAARLTHAYLTAMKSKENSYGSGFTAGSATANIRNEIQSNLELINESANLKSHLKYKDAN